MKTKLSAELGKVNELWNNGFRGSGPDGRIILRDLDLVNQKMSIHPVSQATTVNLGETDSVSLRRSLNIESKKSVPH